MKVRLLGSGATIPGIEPVAQQTEYSCGVGALETIFRFHGKKIGNNLHEITEKGSNHDDIRRIAKKNGFSVNRIGESVADIKKMVSAGHPVLVNYQDYGENNGKNGHYAVVIGYTGKKLHLADPAEGGKKKWMGTRDFVQRWHDPDAPEGERKYWAAVVTPNRLKKIAEKHKFSKVA